MWVREIVSELTFSLALQWNPLRARELHRLDPGSASVTLADQESGLRGEANLPLATTALGVHTPDGSDVDPIHLTGLGIIGPPFHCLSPSSPSPSGIALR